MSNKAVTQMTDPEYKVEFDGEEMYVMCNGVKLAMRRDDCWVSIELATQCIAEWAKFLQRLKSQIV